MKGTCYVVFQVSGLCANAKGSLIINYLPIYHIIRLYYIDYFSIIVCSCIAYLNFDLNFVTTGLILS